MISIELERIRWQGPDTDINPPDSWLVTIAMGENSHQHIISFVELASLIPPAEYLPAHGLTPHRERLYRSDMDNDERREWRKIGLMWLIAAILFFLAAWCGTASGQSLVGDLASMKEQHGHAVEAGYTFFVDAAAVSDAVRLGVLVAVEGNDDYEVDDQVSFPYARPHVRRFLEHLGRGYRAHCGQTLVVTSLTRPLNQQPRHASARSVHPAGIAADLRHSWTVRCHRWLERELLRQEAAGAVQATWEADPPHYHVAVYRSGA